MDRDEILKPRLKQASLYQTALEGAYIFYNGAWWKIRDISYGLIQLQECTNAEAVEIINHPGIRILRGQQ